MVLDKLFLKMEINTLLNLRMDLHQNMENFNIIIYKFTQEKLGQIISNDFHKYGFGTLID